MGASLRESEEENVDDKVKALENINCRRNASVWKNRVIRNDGKMITSSEAIKLAANVIKTEMGIPLSEEEEFAEIKLKKNK